MYWAALTPSRTASRSSRFHTASLKRTVVARIGMCRCYPRSDIATDIAGSGARPPQREPRSVLPPLGKGPRHRRANLPYRRSHMFIAAVDVGNSVQQALDAFFAFI